MSVESYSKVILYKDPNYGGTSVIVGVGRVADIADATGLPRNSLSSLKVAPFTKVTLFSERNLGGNYVSIEGPAEIPDLRRYADGFNDKTESIVVEHLPPTKDAVVKCCTNNTDPAACGPYTAGSSLCDAAIASSCENTMGSSFCQSWCRDHPELCDKQVIAYCAKNPRDPYCACILSKATGVANPKCVDDKCVRFGYMTTNMQRTPCPTVIDCSIQATLINNGVSLSTVVPIEQNCGNSSNTTVTKKTTVTSPTQTPSPVVNYALYVFILVIFIAFMSAILLWSMLGGDAKVAP